MKKCTTPGISYCPTSQDRGTKTCTTPPEPDSSAKGYPGEPCAEDNDCVFQACFNNKC